jgi:hypothetical protein
MYFGEDTNFSGKKIAVPIIRADKPHKVSRPLPNYTVTFRK